MWNVQGCGNDVGVRWEVRYDEAPFRLAEHLFRVNQGFHVPTEKGQGNPIDIRIVLGLDEDLFSAPFQKQVHVRQAFLGEIPELCPDPQNGEPLLPDLVRQLQPL